MTIERTGMSRRRLLTTAAVGVPTMGVLGAVNFFDSPAANARTIVADGWWGTTTKALQDFLGGRPHRQGREPTRFLGRVESRPSHHPGAPGQVRADAGRVSGRSFSDHPGTAEPHQRQRRSDLIPSGGETAVAQQLDVTNASSRSRHGVECCATVYFARVSLQRIRARAPGGTDHPIASTSVPAIVAGPEPQPACHVALQPGAVRGGAVSCARRRPAATGAAQRFGGEIQLSRPAGG